jgi:formamidopyrimidine-DNA glycosylase
VPELPEVETIRSQLAPLVEGRRLLALDVLDPRWSAPLAPDALTDALVGRRVEQLSRRGKYLLWRFDGDVYLAQHLRMTGTVLADPVPEPPHTRVRMRLGPARGASSRRGLRVIVSDPRRFGTGQLLAGPDALAAFLAARLGPEPFDEAFTGDHLRALARGRRAPVKAFLLDQRTVAGVGNIYADEALFRAGIHPLRPAGSLTRAQYERLRDTVREALSAGIDARGASIDDFRHVDGVRGTFQDRFLVHRREGEPCPRCGGEIVKSVVAGRATYACERCQPPPRRRAARAPALRPSGARRGDRPGRRPRAR